MDLKKLLKIFEAVGTGASGFPLQGGQAAKPAPKIGTGAAGFPVQKVGQAAKPAAAPVKKPIIQTSKPPVPTPGVGPQAQAPTMSDRAATDAAVAGTGKSPEASAASTAVDPSIGSGQNLAAMGAAQSAQNAQADFQKLAGITPNISTAADSGQGAKPAPSLPPGLASATAPAGQGAKPAPDTTGMPAGLASAVTPQGSSIGGEVGQTGPKPSGGMVDGSGNPVTSSSGDQIKTGFSEEEELEEELNEMMRLSGLQLNEKAVSKQQQKFMGMVHAMQKGKKIKGASSELKKAAKGMSKKAAHDYAATKHKGLPQRVSESVMLEAGSNLEHIIQRFKHETKNFLNGAELDDDLYNALYDYYVDNGEMPYGVAKAREGDPYQWVGDHFENELAMMGHQRQFQETVMPVVDNSLSELARLAGLSESQIDECGDMMGGEESSMNVSTNMSSDGKKSVTISAQGEEAESLMQMLKLAGMGHHGHDSQSEEPVVMVSGDDEMMDEEYANSPEEEYETVNAITRQGNDLNREKRQYADRPKLGDNPMAEEIALDEELEALLNSVLIQDDEQKTSKQEEPSRVKGTIAPAGSRVSATFPPPGSGQGAKPAVEIKPKQEKVDEFTDVLSAEKGGVKGATMPPADSPYPPGDPRNMKAPEAPKAPKSPSLSTGTKK